MSKKSITVSLLGTGLNGGGWEPVIAFLQERGCTWSVFERHEDVVLSDMILLLGYDRIVPGDILFIPRLGTVLFHSSDLPEGRGWAPLYNTISRGQNLVQTMLYASEQVDAGELIAKARYPLEGHETEEEVRRYDDELTMELLRDSFPALADGPVPGTPQNEEEATSWPRRTPKDSRIDTDMSIDRLLQHLRALPANAPAFVDIAGRRFFLQLTPKSPGAPFKRSKVVIERFYE